MKACLCGLLLAIFSIAVRANPVIIINSDPPPPTPVFSSPFAFAANENGGGYFDFVNETGEPWTTLMFSATLPQGESITCGPGPFTICTFNSLNQQNGLALYTISFGPSASGGGIADGQTFSINLNDNGETNTDPNGAGEWGSEATINAVVNDAPEPAAWMLFVTGIAFAGWFGRRRLRYN